jgi:two-component system chemotaxis sensor kinase CheA
MTELDSVVREFLVESHENLDQLDRDLVALEKNPQDSHRLGSVFRTIHTIKGTCGFFGFGKLESVTHVGENLLSRLRDGHLLLNPERTSALLALVDAIRAMLANIEKTGSDGEGEYQQLIYWLTALQDSGASEAVAPPVPRQPPPNSIGEMLVQQGKVEPKQVLEALQQQAAGDPRRIGEILVAKGAVQPQDVREAATLLDEARGGVVAESNIRVDVSLVDKLMNLVGELVLARNQMLQFRATEKDVAFVSTAQRLNLITTELQESIMKTRMQPIGNIWNRFPRLVRDLAVTCGKQVRLEMDGKDTELDKTIIEAIKDPLTHMVRNAVDHGIEPPDLRVARGKPPEGTLVLRAFHEGGRVNIEISDDGAGINLDRVKQKALERGLLSPDRAARLSDREACQLIFLPGFSTADKISNLSGRGVGMDVVKTNIEKIGGTVDIQSPPGKGTTLKIKIPLTLAIIPALIVTSGGDRYAIPQVSLMELVRLEGEQVRRAIEMIHGAPVYRLRGNLLPLTYLNRELRVESKAQALEQGAINIVVLQADDRQFGLVVDEINDTEEIVVKPLGKQLKGIPVFAGATIRGDGKVALILDVLGIAQCAGVVSEVHDRVLTDLATRPQGPRDARQALLLLGLGRERRLAVPLSVVARLEEIPAGSVEKADGKEVVQYRGQIMPLLRLSELLDCGSGALLDPMQVVVCAEEGRSVGLVVDRILDIVEANIDLQQTSHRSCVRGSAVIQERVTDLLDIRGMIRAAAPAFREELAAV